MRTQIISGYPIRSFIVLIGPNTSTSNKRAIKKSISNIKG
jgi:hypothetical protein